MSEHSLMHELGYSFHMKLPYNPGYGRLEILVSPRPTGKHFDPQTVTLEVSPATAGQAPTEHLDIQLPWHGLYHYHACAGRIIVCDRSGKRVEAFSFGGALRLDQQGDGAMLVTLDSTAPILPLNNPDENSSLNILLANEVEVLMAKRRALWSSQHSDEFERRLAQASPLALYTACLVRLKEKLLHLEGISEDLSLGLARLLRHETEGLENAYRDEIEQIL